MSHTYQALLDELKGIADNLGLWRYGIPAGGFEPGSLVAVPNGDRVCLVGFYNQFGSSYTGHGLNEAFRYVPASVLWDIYKERHGTP